ncbi:hypothetical protein B484DRAFT_458658 [Ochromonadaceae sp. CCMP2298]|nr:hypothetical protein B484DRAFT_458658 [Ochromonadaceae sp. CCMP2298]|eukprot:CAMPEP_0173232074 /NCGR_PEP_ID=MMETSP1142-20121109/8757_1 /TAXON_ID=483371 /ORGANISM="non described non described, Strain CCMP2298" /LENGTH=207 /DNA_ID=CAMNT_0014161541 /DNA_START=24 /DNA_END=647 /DNA_ORIENTATION=+
MSATTKNAGVYSHSYASIPGDAESQESAPLMIEKTETLVPTKRTGMWLFAAVGLALTLFFLLFATSGTPGSPMLGGGDAKNPRDCSFEECSIGGCDIGLAPYLCVDNYPNPMGCSGYPWVDGCGKSCTMKNCASAKPSKNTPTCAGVKCPSTSCHHSNIPDYQVCGGAAPFKCLEGSDAGACSSDPYHYALDIYTTCGKCCDSTTCK